MKVTFTHSQIAESVPENDGGITQAHYIIFFEPFR